FGRTARRGVWGGGGPLLRAGLRRGGRGRGAGVAPAAGPAVNASAGLPLSVVSNTVKAACLFAAGKAAAPGLISAKAAALTEGALKTMFLGKLKIIAAGLGGLAVFSPGASGLLPQSPAGPRPPGQETRNAAPSRQGKTAAR